MVMDIKCIAKLKLEILLYTGLCGTVNSNIKVSKAKIIILNHFSIIQIMKKSQNYSSKVAAMWTQRIILKILRYNGQHGVDAIIWQNCSYKAEAMCIAEIMITILHCMMRQSLVSSSKDSFLARKFIHHSIYCLLIFLYFNFFLL